MMKASGRAALVLLAGLFLLFGGVAQAAPTSAGSSKSDSADKQADTVGPSKQRSHGSRHSSNRAAQKSDDKADKKDAAAKSDGAKADNATPASNQMPPEIANANAQIAAADNTAMPNAENQVVAPDQLNDVDRALQQDNPPAQAVIAPTDAQPRPAPVMASSQSSAWDQSSLIGKIFIGVGALLTLASAARMFIA